jgi:steroid delta-isomerase-like uncharacterized protein
LSLSEIEKRTATRAVPTSWNVCNVHELSTKRKEEALMRAIRVLPAVIAVTALLVLCLAFSCQKQGSQGLTEEEAKALMDRYMEIHNESNLALADEIFHPDFVLKTPFMPEPIVGIQALKDAIANVRATFPDFIGTIEEVVVKGDDIWSRYTMTGTNMGPLGDIPATGKKMHVTGMAITRVADGKIIEDQTFWNVLGLYQQLGFTLVPPQAEEME